jgi:hypothetical protein
MAGHQKQTKLFYINGETLQNVTCGVSLYVLFFGLQVPVLSERGYSYRWLLQEQYYSEITLALHSLVACFHFHRDKSVSDETGNQREQDEEGECFSD